MNTKWLRDSKCKIYDYGLESLKVDNNAGNSIKEITSKVSWTINELTVTRGEGAVISVYGSWKQVRHCQNIETHYLTHLLGKP